MTLDAVLPQRQRAPQIVAARGDSGMGGKEHQPQVLADLQTVCALAPLAGERRPAAATVALGHGRSAPRGLQTRNLWAGSRDWPGVAQGFRLERPGIVTKTGEVREAVVAGVPSLAPERAAAAR